MGCLIFRSHTSEKFSSFTGTVRKRKWSSSPPCDKARWRRPPLCQGKVYSQTLGFPKGSLESREIRWVLVALQCEANAAGSLMLRRCRVPKVGKVCHGIIESAFVSAVCGGLTARQHYWTRSDQQMARVHLAWRPLMLRTGAGYLDSSSNKPEPPSLFCLQMR